MSITTTREWSVCRDNRHGFSLRHPPEWHSTTEEGRCVQLQKGARGESPCDVPEVDVFLSVEVLGGAAPGELLRDRGPRGGVEYSERGESTIGGLPAVRARFRSFGDQPNWGIEYAIRKDDRVLRIYISRPDPQIEELFDRMVTTLRW
jgi:hypothetical protein